MLPLIYYLVMIRDFDLAMPGWDIPDTQLLNQALHFQHPPSARVFSGNIPILQPIITRIITNRFIFEFPVFPNMCHRIHPKSIDT